jgi:hypothetical protein
MTDECISPLRRRMIEDTTVRNFVAKTQADYVRRIRNFAIRHADEREQQMCLSCNSS